MELPSHLINQVKQGRIVLFLGAGANKDALTPDKKDLPLGNELRDRIAMHFLNGDYSSESLAWVSELASSATDLFTVQDFIADQFRDIMPANYHYLIPSFRWRGIATTNYDRLVEITYNNSKEPVQTIVPFLSNSDRVDEKLRDPSSVALLKLHGCITRTHDKGLPLILTLDQYATFRDGRTRIFQMLEEWGSENSIIFIGHRLQDPNLRGILLDLCQRIPSRPRYFIVRPHITPEERDFWGGNGKRVSVLEGTFEEFLKALDAAIPKNFRSLSLKFETEHPICLRFIVKEKPSQSLLELLTNELEYVHEGVHFSEGDPSRFYSGFGLGWYPIIKNFDVRRQLLNKLLEDIVLRTENDRPSKIELYAIKAEAGAGKSILLRRLAWEAAINAGVLCLYGRGTTSLNFEPLREISTATAQRIFLFIDNAADNMLLIHEIIEFARSNKLSLTIITAERANEWNVRCESLENYLSDQYHLAYLNHSEIENLVNLLTKFNALGPNLSIKTFEEQVNEFEKKAGRQLLVALHEATHGRPFEEILIDEYNNIIPQEAQRLYLTVCVLNRLGVPVRAGLISRVHGIPFEMFQDRLFEPLEHVVQVIKLPWGDLAYQARHSEIAKIVFDQILTDSAEKFNEYIRIIKALNPVFSVDYQSLRGMLRAKWIHDLFPNFEDAKAIYQSADNILKDDAYLFQQMANYERIRPNGNFLYAQTLLERARVLEPSNHTIVHTLAEVLRARAESTQKKLEKARFRKEARSLLQNIPDTASSAKYAVVTQLKICIDFVRESLIDESSTDRDIDEAIRDTERAFENGRQRYPGDSFILTAEAEFAKLLKDHQRAFDALKQARRLNPRDPFLATRLAALLASNGDLDTAKTYLEEALESNRGDRRLNFQFAELLRLKGESSPKDLIYFYRRAFIKGDHNYQSQFWYARFAFESKDSEKIRESKEIFKYLRETPMAYEERIRIQDAVGGLNSPRQFSGTISRVEATHGFLTTDGSGDRLFFHETDVVGGVWDRLISGTRVIFAIGFNLRGPKAYDLRIEGVSL